MNPLVRRHPRIRVPHPRNLEEAGLFDLSVTGLFVLSAEVWPVGQSVQFDIDIEMWGKVLHLVGRVVRVEERPGVGRGMAVALEHLDPESHRWLERLVEDLEEREKLGARAETLPPWEARARKERGPTDGNGHDEPAGEAETKAKPVKPPADTRPIRKLDEKDLR